MRAKKATVALARETESTFGGETETDSESEALHDPQPSGSAECQPEIGVWHGFSRYRDPVTQALGLLASEWEGMNKSWQAAAARARIAGTTSRCAETLNAYRDELRALRDGDRAKYLERELRAHVLYPWLKSHRGCPKSVHTARIISMIGDPMRFPGRQCEKCKGYLPADYEGTTCNHIVKGMAAESATEIESSHSGHSLYSKIGPAIEHSPEIESRNDGWVLCGGTLIAPRPGTGTRALWHYFGLHVIDGKRPRHQRGQQSDWKDEGYTALLQPDGIADMVIRQKCEPWYGVYVGTKERICRERGVDAGSADMSESSDDVNTSRPECGSEIEVAAGPKFTRMHAHKIGRVVLAKAFVGDLLAEWKRVVARVK